MLKEILENLNEKFEKVSLELGRGDYGDFLIKR